MATTSTMGAQKVPNRHCAYCLISLYPDQVKVCGSCRRHAYCSRECQSVDWSPKKFGQKHKYWCSMNCGEEDLDWKVVPVAGKGLGIIALEDIPAHSKIMIDGFRAVNMLIMGSVPDSITESIVHDLEPKNCSIQEKIRVNGFRDSKGIVISARLARVNHSCRPNAVYLPDEVRNVQILFSLCDIKQDKNDKAWNGRSMAILGEEQICMLLVGEEILITYAAMDDAEFKKHSNPVKCFRIHLEKIYGIVCPVDCLCRKDETPVLLEERIKLFDLVFGWYKPGITSETSSKLKELAAAVERLIQIYEAAPVLGSRVLDIFYIGSLVARLMNNTKLSNVYFGRGKTLSNLMFHPSSMECDLFNNELDTLLVQFRNV